jgi:hypothetical protein
VIVEDTAYGHVVRRKLGDKGTSVIPLDQERRLYWCTSCAAYGCGHARAVIQYLVDREAAGG